MERSEEVTGQRIGSEEHRETWREGVAIRIVIEINRIAAGTSTGGRRADNRYNGSVRAICPRKQSVASDRTRLESKWQPRLDQSFAL